jgi:short-subunit dehydrogenase
LTPGPLQAVYYATKAYVTSFSNAIAEELKDTNITVTALMPGATETEFGQTSGMDKTKLYDTTFNARKVAEKGYNAMLKGKLNVVAGVTKVQRLMFSLFPFMPKRMQLRIVRRNQEVKEVIS